MRSHCTGVKQYVAGFKHCVYSWSSLKSMRQNIIGKLFILCILVESLLFQTYSYIVAKMQLYVKLMNKNAKPRSTG